MRRLTEEEVVAVSGGVVPIAATALVGATVGGLSAYASGVMLDKSREQLLSEQWRPFTAWQRLPLRGGSRTIYTGYAIATTGAGGLFTRSSGVA